MGNLALEQRKYISDIYKTSLDLTDDEYAQLYRKIANIQDISTIKDTTIVDSEGAERTIKADALKKIAKKASDSLMNLDNWNESIVYNPKIKAVIHKMKSTNPETNPFDEIPQQILDLAREQDLPITKLNNHEKRLSHC